MTLTELKAAAYDLIANIEYLQKSLDKINKQIAEAVKEKENGSSNSNNNN